MDEYTFIAEDADADNQSGAVPTIQNVSAEQLYKNELLQEMQVHNLFTHASCAQHIQTRQIIHPI